MKTNGRQDISEDKHFSVILQLAIKVNHPPRHNSQATQLRPLTSRCCVVLKVVVVLGLSVECLTPILLIKVNTVAFSMSPFPQPLG